MKRILIKAAWIITMNEQNDVIKNGFIELNGNTISRIGTYKQGEMDERFYDEIIEAPHMAVLPGLVNIHTHVCGNLFKGMLEDTVDGFYKLALPMEDQLTSEYVYQLSLLGAAECLMGGTTLINDLYHRASDTARAIDLLGMRAVLANKIYETDLSRIQYRDYTRDHAAGQRRLDENIALIEKYHMKGDGRITCKFGPHATDTVSLELAKQIGRLGEKYGVGYHVHAAQMPQEVDFLREKYNLSPIEYLQESGLLNKNTTVAHCLHVNDSDIALLAKGGAMLAHCPDMNGNKGGPLAPMKKMYDAGVQVAYGTDWTASDLWSTMRMGVTVGKLFGCSQLERNATDALRRCTILPARHLGLDHMVGSLEAGKRADLILVDTNHPSLCSIHGDIVPTLVYNACARDVDTVMVDGQILVRNKQLVCMDMHQILSNALEIAHHIHKG